MSSRLLPPDDGRPVLPVAWPSVESSTSRCTPHVGPDSRAGSEQIEAEVEQRLRAAHAAGFAEGEAAGRSRAGAELQPVIAKLSRGIEELAALRPRLRREAEADLVKLALAIARRILNRDLAMDPDALRGLILGALERLQGQEVFRVRVHPAHAALVTALLPSTPHGSSVQVIAEPGCELGTVIFESERGSLDASVASQLQEIERGLTDRLRSCR